jgi:hypothetical protein
MEIAIADMTIASARCEIGTQTSVAQPLEPGRIASAA